MIYRDSKGRFCKAPVKGYKGFEQGLICRGKQYKVGEVFTESEAVLCKNGIHFCKNPLDVLKFYPPVNKNGVISEYSEVEALEEPVTDDNIKFCTTKLKVVRKLSLGELAQIGIDYALQHNQNVEKIGNDYSIATDDRIHITGTNIYDYNGTIRNINSNTGHFSVAASNGYRGVAVTNGDYSAAIAIGDYNVAVSTGYCNTVSVSGKHSVAVNIGYKGKVKGALGCWIACAEWKNNTIADFKSAYVDGKKIKADTWYRLENGKFVEI